VLLVTDPTTDAQPVAESAYVNIPVIAFCDIDCPVRNVDIAIPCNNKSPESLALVYWLLAREVLRMRGGLSRAEAWNVMVDLFMYRDPEKLGETAAEGETAVQPEAEPTETADFGATQPAKVPEWGAETGEYGAGQPWSGDNQNWSAAPAAAAAAAATGGGTWDQTAGTSGFS